MYSRMKTRTSTSSYLDDLERLKEVLENTNTIIIGAGAGLSTAAGYVYNGERFEKYFSDFEERYGFHDMYTGGFYPYQTLEEYWAFWSRYIYVNRYVDIPNNLYSEIYELVKDKDYFVITTNVDHCFQRAGFDKKRLFYTQGDYGLLQCSEPCCQETFDNEKIIKEMYEQQEDMKIPTKLIPICPHCGKPLTTNLRADDRFVEDEGWHKAKERYNQFLERHSRMPILYLELGVGFNTPVIIKYPFMQLTYNNPKATYCSINFGQAYAPKEIIDRSICINEDIHKVISDMI